MAPGRPCVTMWTLWTALFLRDQDRTVRPHSLRVSSSSSGNRTFKYDLFRYDCVWYMGSHEGAENAENAKPNKKGQQRRACNTPLLLPNERVMHNFHTLAEFTFGMPRHQLLCTNKRLIVRESNRLLGIFGKTSEHTIQYRCVSQQRQTNASRQTIYTSPNLYHTLAMASHS
jgi:hypothetical protein